MVTNPALLPDSSPDPREHVSARAEALVESYRRLAAVFHDVLSEQSPEALLDRIADTLAELVPYQDLHIYEADEKRRELRPVFARSAAWVEEILSNPVVYGQGITGWAVEHRSPVLTNEAHLDPRVAFVPGTPQDPEALITVPLIARGSVKGALNIYRTGEDASFDEDEFELARWFGDAAALALDNAQIRARLEHLAHTDSLTGLYNHRYFHERLRSEFQRAGRAHDRVALMMLDIDDFKRVNDVCGHGEGDSVLQLLGEILQRVVRGSDTVCRVGGEEFAVILPSCGPDDAVGLAARLKEALLRSPAESVVDTTLSIGVAFGPEHAMNARELVACAEAAMMTAKAQGKDRVVVFEEEGAGERPLGSEGRDVRSIAHLKMLQSLVGKLNRLNDVREIGEAIVDELRMLIDYHNCSVYLREGEVLHPVAVRGENAADIGLTTLQLGHGLTGHVAVSGKPALVSNVRESDICTSVTGQEADESLACAPLRYGQRVIGVITLSKLGVGQFDEDDLRLLEVLAGHASVSLENARLYDSLRKEADNAKAWLEFADAVSEAGSVEGIGAETVRTVSRLMEAEQCSMWLEDSHAADYRCIAQAGYSDHPLAAPVLSDRGRAAAAHFVEGRKTPFLLCEDDVKHMFPQERSLKFEAAAVAPLHAGVGVRGWISVPAPEGDLGHFTDERLRLLEGLSYPASVALQKSVLLQSEQASAEIESALLEFSRRLAGVSGQDELQKRIVELTGEMLDSPRTWLWLERGRPGSFAIAAAWRADGAVPIVPIGSVVEFGGTRRSLERGEPFVLEPGTVNLVPEGEDPLAVAPVVLPSGRIGCIAAAAPEAFAERKLRLIAGIANQASLALHIS
ncbi:MAG TPA: GAF domain-containing protein [Gaiellaceae bacterium]|nr:GAF domain-containing protein [Gaiellaceae bacterium]